MPTSRPDDVLIQYPRAVVSLSASLTGETDLFDAVVIPRKVVVTRRPHTQADTCEVHLDGVDVPFDPRAVRDVILTVHMANVRDAGAGDMRDDWRTANTLRFIGHADTFDNEQEDDDTLTLKARDLSSLFREAKPVPPEAVPRYGDTLRQAIQRIIDVVPGGDVLAVAPGPEADAVLYAGVDGRARNAHIHVESNWSAWEVIEHAAGLVSRLVNVRNDFIVVRQGSQAYTNTNTPAATFSFNSVNANLTSLKVEKKFARNRKGVRVVSFDPYTRTRREADYPSDAVLNAMSGRRQRPARTGGGGHGGGHGGAGRARAPAQPKPVDRDVFIVPGVTVQGQLEDIARQIWEERSRQEISVNLDTPLFDDPYLSLQNGDRVIVELNRAIAAGLNPSQPFAQQVAFVRRRLQVSQAAASMLVRAAQNAGVRSFYVHEVQLVWDGEATDGGGDTGVKLEVINLIPVEVR